MSTSVYDRSAKEPPPNAPLLQAKSKPSDEFASQETSGLNDLPSEIRPSVASLGQHVNEKQQAERPKTSKSRTSTAQPRQKSDPPTGIEVFQKSYTQKLEREAQTYHDELKDRIKNEKGRYLRDDEGNYHLLLNGKRIPLNHDRDNHDLNALLLDACRITVHVPAAKPTIARLINGAYKATVKFTMRRFSAFSKDGKRLYIPVKDQKELLQITAEEIKTVPNGDNKDQLYVEHPNLDPESEPFEYVVADPKPGLAEFERLIVNSQACQVPEMAWFVALQECFFPFIRDSFQDRVIIAHEGPQGSGKTSGASFPSLLHGLVVTGDATPAVLSRIGDCGLLVMDNKEQSNMNQGFNDFILFLATGADRFRCAGHGIQRSNGHRPVGVLTSIEGAYKAEMIDRIIEVSYNAHERDRASFNKEDIRTEIIELRSKIRSAMMPVLSLYLQIRRDDVTIEVPERLSRFGENYRALVRFLRAYGDLAGKPPGWTDHIVEVWRQTITAQSHEESGDELEYMIRQFLRALEKEPADGTAGTARDPRAYIKFSKRVTHKAKTGTLTVTTCEQLMDWLGSHDHHGALTVRNPAALGRRLRNLRSPWLRVLDDKNAPELPELKREKNQRFIGLFEPDDA